AADGGERGGGADGGAGGSEIPREGLWRQRDTARWSARRTAGGGPDHRRGRGGDERGANGGRSGRPRHAARSLARPPALSLRCASSQCRSAILEPLKSAGAGAHGRCGSWRGVVV